MSLCKSRFLARAALTALLLPLSTAVLAHVTLAVPEAAIDSYYKATFVVSHGCSGSPTTKIKVRIPDGVLAIKPQPKAGWTLSEVEGAYAKTYSLHGAEIASGVREVTWSGRLLDGHYDEFVLQGYLSPSLKAGSSVPFPVVQECETGVSRWIDPNPKAELPAPRLKLLSAPATSRR